MFYIILNITFLTVVAFACEQLWRYKKISSETSRKMLHFVGGTLAVFWPLYLSWSQIQLTVVLIVVAIMLLRVSGVAKSFFAVNRRTFGDILGPATVGILIFFTPPVILYVLIVLHITYADGLAAIVGKKFGKTNTYTVLGYKKSIVGTATCGFVSLIILLGCLWIGAIDVYTAPIMLIVFPVAVAVVENISVLGIDNTLIAATVALLGKAFAIY